jgi:hypothetical protein
MLMLFSKNDTLIVNIFMRADEHMGVQCSHHGDKQEITNVCVVYGRFFKLNLIYRHYKLVLKSNFHTALKQVFEINKIMELCTHTTSVQFIRLYLFVHPGELGFTSLVDCVESAWPSVRADCRPIHGHSLDDDQNGSVRASCSTDQRLHSLASTMAVH